MSIPTGLGANAYHRRNYYSAGVISHIVDFAETVRVASANPNIRTKTR